MLTPWRQVLGKAFAGKQAADIIRWVQDSICVDETRNPIHLCMSPLGVFRHRVTDGHSRDIFFVSAARSAGIPARINSITGQVQWADSDGQWREVHFGEATSEVPATCRLRLTYTDTDVKEHLSDFEDWDQKDHAAEWVLFAQNMGTHLSMLYLNS